MPRPRRRKPRAALRLSRSPRSIASRAAALRRAWRLTNADTERAIAALGASLERDEELPREVRDVVRSAVLREWNRTAKEVRHDVAYRFATELLDTRAVSDATFAAALDALGERRLVNLIVLMGHSNIRCAQQALAGTDCVL